MKRLIFIFSIVLGLTTGLTSLPANAFEFSYGPWMLTKETMTINTKGQIVFHCQYARKRWMGEFKFVDDTMLNFYTHRCPPPGRAGLPQ